MTVPRCRNHSPNSGLLRCSSGSQITTCYGWPRRNKFKFNVNVARCLDSSAGRSMHWEEVYNLAGGCRSVYMTLHWALCVVRTSDDVNERRKGVQGTCAAKWGERMYKIGERVDVVWRLCRLRNTCNVFPCRLYCIYSAHYNCETDNRYRRYYYEGVQIWQGRKEERRLYS